MPGWMEAKNTIDAAEVNRALGHTRLGGYVLHFDEVGSTNDLALEAAQAGARRGVWVADAQTAGRGRGGHQWHSAPGDGLYVSTLFTPRLPARNNAAGSLSLLAGLAAWEAIREVSGIVADIRWPNDLVTRPKEGSGARSRKLGGVLTETAVAPAAGPGREPMLRYAVIGIGLNVAHPEFPPELAEVATSLFREGWTRPERQPLLIALLDKLDLYVRRQEDSYAGTMNGPGPWPELSEASTWITGKRVYVPEDGGYTGVTAGLDRQGFLLVEADDGSRRTVRSGGVREV